MAFQSVFNQQNVSFFQHSILVRHCERQRVSSILLSKHSLYFMSKVSVTSKRKIASSPWRASRNDAFSICHKHMEVMDNNRIRRLDCFFQQDCSRVLSPYPVFIKPEQLFGHRSPYFAGEGFNLNRVFYSDQSPIPQLFMNKILKQYETTKIIETPYYRRLYEYRTSWKQNEHKARKTDQLDA